MEVRADSSISIKELLGLKGTRRLSVCDDITRKLTDHSEVVTPGARLRFIESKSFCGWNEYYALYEITKYLDTAEYLSYVFKCASDIIKELIHLDLDSIGIQEIECGEANNYYILIYIIKDEDKERENKC